MLASSREALLGESLFPSITHAHTSTHKRASAAGVRCIAPRVSTPGRLTLASARGGARGVKERGNPFLYLPRAPPTAVQMKDLRPSLLSSSLFGKGFGTGRLFLPRHPLVQHPPPRWKRWEIYNEQEADARFRP
ncbi:hypothetical protein MRX96_040597 [Rhipicephalus microplus]